MERARRTGKSAELEGLIRDHPVEFTYELRKLGWRIRDIGRTVSVTEVADCIEVAARDTGSWLHAAIHGWQYPMSREAMILANIYDSSEANRLGKKFKPSARPWPQDGAQKIGRTDLAPADARELLRRNRAGENT